MSIIDAFMWGLIVLNSGLFFARINSNSEDMGAFINLLAAAVLLVVVLT